MVKLQTFLIALDNPIGTYYAGQNVTGKVKIHLNQIMEMRGVYLKFQGQEYVHWTERRSRSNGSGGTTSETVHRRATHDYFDIKQCMWGSGERGPLAAGYYEFPFNMQLPSYLPSSFEGQYGHIRYHCKAYIDRPWKFDPACKEPFTVLSIVDLNHKPEAIKPLAKQNHKHLGCLCCKSGPITATISLNKLGVVPGENIFINGTIDNVSDSYMERTYAVLTAKTIYHAQSHVKCETKEVARVERGPIHPNGSDSWVNVPLKVPPLPPTTDSQLIYIEYSLVFVVDPSGMSFDLEIEMPIIIGTIPLRVDFSSFNAMQNPYMAPAGTTTMTTSFGYGEPQIPSAPSLIGFTPSAPGFIQAAPQTVMDTYPDMPPPSYQEVFSGKVDIREDDDNEHTGGRLDYAPRYTYYNQDFRR